MQGITGDYCRLLCRAGSDLGLQHSGGQPPRMKGLAGGERSREEYAFVNTGRRGWERGGGGLYVYVVGSAKTCMCRMINCSKCYAR